MIESYTRLAGKPFFRIPAVCHVYAEFENLPRDLRVVKMAVDDLMQLFLMENGDVYELDFTEDGMRRSVALIVVLLI